MFKLIDLSGKRFGRITVLSRADSRKGQTMWKCVCECGNFAVVKGPFLSGGMTTSCGCVRREVHTKHGYATRSRGKDGEYTVWAGMMSRCSNPKGAHYKHYGGRGIFVCERWHSFINFIADMGPRPSSSHSIDRRDNNGNYEPSNCYWATKLQQVNNTSANHILEFEGNKMSIADWARAKNIPYARLSYRIQVGWPTEKALTEPARFTPTGNR